MGRFDLQPRKPKKGATPPSQQPQSPSPTPMAAQNATQTMTSAPKIRPAKGRSVSLTQSFLNGFWRGAIVFVLIALFVLGSGIIGAAIMVGRLPEPKELENRASTFQ